MTPTEEILAIAPDIICSYGISFLLLPFNIFSTYYFQALMRPMASFIVSVSRGGCGQRGIDLYSPGCGRSRCDLVCYAGYGTAGCSLCNGENGAVHEGSIGPIADEVGHD